MFHIQTFHCLSYCQVDQKSEFSLCLRKLENCRKSEGFVNLCVFRDVSQSYSELEIRNFVELSRKLSRTRKPVHFCNNLTRNQLPKFLHAFKQLSCGIYTHISEWLSRTTFLWSKPKQWFWLKYFIKVNHWQFDFMVTIK